MEKSESKAGQKAPKPQGFKGCKFGNSSPAKPAQYCGKLRGKEKEIGSNVSPESRQAKNGGPRENDFQVALKDLTEPLGYAVVSP
ncbi:uncharacterized protein N7506_003511 [Penicillium brevicompactum]|uniref:uncharacterized protein n=1 Tax=Penicillium brevicompactum TaxID=5074 RepID=UPI0025423E68|nr:uncharacterized protein N7506_003511 [Penicillium brevicompactum]KAJ5343687.1 hypothetical protein N7506_003511 [Penicillium brevicompactum]